MARLACDVALESDVSSVANGLVDATSSDVIEAPNDSLPEGRGTVMVLVLVEVDCECTVVVDSSEFVEQTVVSVTVLVIVGVGSAFVAAIDAPLPAVCGDGGTLEFVSADEAQGMYTVDVGDGSAANTVKVRVVVVLLVEVVVVGGMSLR